MIIFQGKDGFDSFFEALINNIFLIFRGTKGGTTTIQRYDSFFAFSLNSIKLQQLDEFKYK